SKSLNNAIYISDTAKQVQKKVNKIFTGRQSPTEEGDPENILMQYCDIFIPDADRVAEIKRRYAAGDDIGDGHIKQELGACINELLDPMRERRLKYENDDDVIDVRREGTRRANAVTEDTLALAKEASGLGFFKRTLQLD
ncbi:MAG: tryptophan--tRNA ligase, partial [Planctomycetaceae bacterium]|nr:tryptophan--tRNA ligase [Planctomycetaceae bacterium]